MTTGGGALVLLSWEDVKLSPRKKMWDTLFCFIFLFEWFAVAIYSQGFDPLVDLILRVTNFLGWALLFIPWWGSDPLVDLE